VGNKYPVSKATLLFELKKFLKIFINADPKLHIGPHHLKRNSNTSKDNCA
jgi:hypothetical protein